MGRRLRGMDIASCRKSLCNSDVGCNRSTSQVAFSFSCGLLVPVLG